MRLFHAITENVLTKKKNTFVSRNAGDEKNLYPHGSKLNFLINLTDFLKKVYTQITTLAALFFVEKQTVLPFIVQRKKSQFIRINLLVVNHLNGEFY